MTFGSAAPFVLLVPIDRSALVGGLALASVGTVMLALWWLLTRRRRACFHRRRRVEGTVAMVSEHADFSGMPRVEYADDRGVTHVVRGTTSSPGYAPNDKHVVYYDPENPTLAITKDDLIFSRLAAAGAAVLLLTGVGCVIAYLVAAP